MRAPSGAERESIFQTARERSGAEDVLEYPVRLAGHSVVLCKLSAESWRGYVDAIYKGNGRNGRAMAIARARIWPGQDEVASACANIPRLADALAGQIERLHGANAEYLSVIAVDAGLDSSAVAALGVEPQKLEALRSRYPNEGQLKVASYWDEELGIRWACILKVPTDMAHDLARGSMRERGYEAAITYLANALAEPAGKDGEAFVRANPHVAVCLFPFIISWAETVAAERPTIWRRKSPASATSTEPPMSLPNASPILASSDMKRHEPPGSS